MTYIALCHHVVTSHHHIVLLYHHTLSLPVIEMIGECPGCDGKDGELSLCNSERWGTIMQQQEKLENCCTVMVKVGELSNCNGE